MCHRHILLRLTTVHTFPQILGRSGEATTDHRLWISIYWQAPPRRLNGKTTPCQCPHRQDHRTSTHTTFSVIARSPKVMVDCRRSQLMPSHTLCRDRIRKRTMKMVIAARSVLDLIRHTLRLHHHPRFPTILCLQRLTILLLRPLHTLLAYDRSAATFSFPDCVICPWRILLHLLPWNHTPKVLNNLSSSKHSIQVQALVTSCLGLMALSGNYQSRKCRRWQFRTCSTQA